MTFIIFFSVFLAVYSFVNYYIFSRIWQVLPSFAPLRAVYVGLSVFLSLAFIGGRLLERFRICTVSDFTIWTGSFWLAFMLYLFIGFLLIDIIRIGIQLAPVGLFAGDGVYAKNSFRKISVVAIVVIASLLVMAGHFNAVSPRVRLLEISIDKKTTISALNVVMVSDIHCGTIIGNSRLEKMVSVINSLKPDIVLLAGDIVDEDLKPVIEQNLGETLKNIRARDGVYAVTGNHEYIGGVENAVEYLEEHGIRVLRDRWVLVNGAYFVVGREDRGIGRFTQKRRKKLETIMEGVDKRMPVVLMDHQPYGLDEAAGNGIDLQLSGHTHHGQMWPLNLITQKIYELSWGYKLTGSTHYYVSCGFGTWGPPVRVGNRPEIVRIKINFR